MLWLPHLLPLFHQTLWNIWGRCAGCGGMWGHLRSAMFLGFSSYCRAGDYLGLWGSDSVYSTEWRSRRSTSQRYIQHMMGCSTPAPWFCCCTHSFSPQKKCGIFGTVSFLHVFVFCQKRSCFPFRSVLCWLIVGDRFLDFIGSVMAYVSSPSHSPERVIIWMT